MDRHRSFEITKFSLDLLTSLEDFLKEDKERLVDLLEEINEAVQKGLSPDWGSYSTNQIKTNDEKKVGSLTKREKAYLFLVLKYKKSLFQHEEKMLLLAKEKGLRLLRSSKVSILKERTEILRKILWESLRNRFRSGDLQTFLEIRKDGSIVTFSEPVEKKQNYEIFGPGNPHLN